MYIPTLEVKKTTLIKLLHVVTHTLVSTLRMFWVVTSSCCAVYWLPLDMLVRQSNFDGTIYKNTTVFLRRAVGNHANEGGQQTHRHCLVSVYVKHTGHVSDANRSALFLKNMTGHRHRGRPYLMTVTSLQRG